AVAFETHGDSVTLKFADGATATGDLLIGADGVNSVIRAQLHPAQPPPAPSGYIALRGASNAIPAMGGLQGLWYFGHRLEAAAVQSGPGTIYWFASLLADDVRDVVGDVRQMRAHLLSRMDAQFAGI